MMTPRMAGFRCCHSPWALVTVMKSPPKNTPATPFTSNSWAARGDFWAASCVTKSRGAPFTTGWPGKNLRVAGFGVASVWMNMVDGSSFL